MTPNFALSLSFEGIRLLWRNGDSWGLIDHVGLDADSLIGELAALRGKASAFAPDNLNCKLIIPNDQIKYLTLDVENPSITAIEDELAGATPYSLNELAYDWVSKDGKTYVAAVAKVTLAEAEHFATEHRFMPLCFVAAAPEGSFPSEVFFGPTAAASDLGIDVASLSRDTQPVIEQGMAVVPAPVSVDETQITDVDVEPADSFDDITVETDGAPAPAEIEDSQQPVDVPAETTAKEVTQAETDAPDTPAAATADQAALAEDAQTVEVQPTPEITNDEAAAPLPVMPSLGGASRNIPVPPAVDTSVTPDPAPESKLAPPITGQSETALDEKDAVAAATGLKAEPAAPPEPEEPTPTNPTGMFLSRRTSARKKDAPIKVKSTKVPSPQDERTRMTIFGARSKKKAVGGKPRFLGLILTVILLIFLAGVAAWASLFTEDGLAGLFSSDDTDTEITLIAPAGLPSDAIPQNADQTTAPDAMTQAALATPSPDEIEDAASENVPPVAPNIEFDANEAARYYAATGIWTLPPNGPQLPLRDDLDDLYLASIDGRVTAYDAIALPSTRTALTDLGLSTPSTPVALDTVFDKDERGFVIATPEGAVTPNGVTVYAGKPQSVPPVRPNTVASDALVLADDSLRGFRPQLRPATLVEENERLNLGGLTRSELASVRPKTRTANIAVAAASAAAAKAVETAAREAEEEKRAAEAQAIADAEAAADADPTASGTRFAVAASQQPAPRPRNFSQTVKRAQAAAERQATQVASVAPRTVTPSGPSTSTVARQATLTNALNLRRMNLIGVSGTNTARKALVRLSNGRFVTVQSGDRLDGGRVSSITETSLNYVKGGRNITLKMGV